MEIPNSFCILVFDKHKVMEKDFTPHQESLELKELGFNEPCIRGWSATGQIWYHPDSDVILDNPTFSQAFRFFRENYDLSGEVNKNDKLMIEYVRSKGERYLPLYHWSYCKDNGVSGGSASTYEEAELACLQKLIEIVKNKPQ